MCIHSLHTVIRTPHLDALAQDGVRFTNAFCTSASCAASRATILTGMQNHTTGTYGHTHAQHHFSCFDTVRTLPAVLKDAGYRTCRVGKQHYAPEHLFPFDGGYPVETFARDDVSMSVACRDLIRDPEPFFLYWCSLNPHRAGTLDSHPLRPDTFGNPPEAFAGDEEQPYTEEQVVVPPFLSDTPEVRAELAQYYQSISRLDRGVGRLVSVLREEGKLENTVIIYISDNGAAFPEAKTTLYEPMRVVRTKRYKFIWNIAWKLDYSFASDLWASSSWQAALREQVTMFGNRTVGAYIHRPRFELYDLDADPDELVNLAGSSQYDGMVRDFSDKLKTFQEETDDPWLHKWTYE